MFGILALIVAAALLGSGGKPGPQGPQGPAAPAGGGGGATPGPKPCKYQCSGSEYASFQSAYNAAAKGAGLPLIAVDGCVGPATCAAAQNVMNSAGNVDAGLLISATVIATGCGC